MIMVSRFHTEPNSEMCTLSPREAQWLRPGHMYDEQKLDVIEIVLLGNKCISSSQMPILREEYDAYLQIICQ